MHRPMKVRSQSQNILYLTDICVLFPIYIFTSITPSLTHMCIYLQQKRINNSVLNIHHVVIISVHFLSIYVNNPWNICVTNFKIYTNKHLCTSCMHIHYVAIILGILLFGNHVCFFVTFRSKFMKYVLENFKFYTHMHFCTMHMYISNMDSIPGILHVVAISALLFHIFINHSSNVLCHKLQILETCASIYCALINKVTSPCFKYFTFGINFCSHLQCLPYQLSSDGPVFRIHHWSRLHLT